MTTAYGAPLILGFDTSGPACDVALVRGDEVLAHLRADMAKGQAEHLLGMCGDVLAMSGHDPAALSAIGVGIGPGNFTGIRIAVSAARGMALGLGVPAIGVSTFDAVRFGHSGPCGCAVRARAGEVYLQIHDGTRTIAPTIEALATLPAFDGPLIGEGGAAPSCPAAVAICHVARARLGSPQPRPAPLYLRPADAAPARDAPPRMLA
jgi:N6-L-threonylcarbamoyladenine synthase